MSRFERMGNYERPKNIEQDTKYENEFERRYRELGIANPRDFMDNYSLSYDQDTLTAIEIWRERKLRERELEQELERKREIEKKIGNGEFLEATDAQMTTALEEGAERQIKMDDGEIITPRVQEILDQIEEKYNEKCKEDAKREEIARKRELAAFEQVEKRLKEMREKLEKRQTQVKANANDEITDSQSRRIR